MPIAGCGSDTVRATSLSSPPPPRPPLVTLLPSGASLVLRARPAELFGDPALAPLAAALVPGDVRDRLARRTGVEADEVREVVYAEYEDGFLVLAEGPWSAADVVVGSSVRMNTIDVRSSSPWVRRGGFIGTERYELVAFADDRVAVSKAAGTPLVAALGRLRSGAWGEGDEPLLGATSEAEELMRSRAASPCVLLVPTHLEIAPSDLAVLLAHQSAILLSLDPDGAAGVDISIVIRGRFPPSAEDNFRTLIRSIAGSEIGASLGIDSRLRTLGVEASEDEVAMHLSLESTKAATGLEHLLGADTSRLLGN